MAQRFRDINEPAASYGKKKEEPREKKPTSGVENYQGLSTAAPVEYRITHVRPVEPEHGFRRNKAYDIVGQIEPLVEKITQPRIMLYPVGIYQGSEDNFFPNGIEAFPDKDGKFRVTCSYLLNAMGYDNDDGKPDDATWVLVIRAQGRTAENDFESEPLTFPRTAKPFVSLRKGHYDDNGASRYGKPREGDDYVAGDAVKLLQQDLATLRFLPKGEDDGVFGDGTDEAVRAFQRIAIDTYRMPHPLGKLIEAETTLQQASPDGVVGPKTRDEKWPWEFKTLKGKKGADTDAGYFEGSYEAQFLRFVAGASAGSEFDLKAMKLQLTASTNASYSPAFQPPPLPWTTCLTCHAKRVASLPDFHNSRIPFLRFGFRHSSPGGYCG